MAETPTPRLGLPHWSAGTDDYPGREGWNRILDLIDDNVALALPSGPRSNRPQAGLMGRFFLATDESVSTGGRLYYDNGTGWVELNTNGDGGVGRPLTVGTTGTEGTSPRSARADHTHPVPLATSTTDGLMPKGLADMLQKANANYTSATVLTLAMRNWRGAIQVNDPMDQYDATTKRWVENTVGTWDFTPSSLVRRGTDGNFYVTDPTKPSAVSTKRYTDTKASREQWKENVRPLGHGLPELLEVATIVYDYKDDAPDSGTDQVGAMVEQVAELLPGLVTYDEDGAPERIRDRELIWVVVNALQDLAVENDNLREELAGLQDEVASIRHHLGIADPSEA